jgi:hypothetical protein
MAGCSEGSPKFSSVRKPDRPAAAAADPFVFACTGDADLGLLVVGETECSLWRSILGLLMLCAGSSTTVALQLCTTHRQIPPLAILFLIVKVCIACS